MPTLCSDCAEREGFEPPVTTRATAVFETAPIVHSGISPIGYLFLTFCPQALEEVNKQRSRFFAHYTLCYIYPVI